MLLLPKWSLRQKSRMKKWDAFDQWKVLTQTNTSLLSELTRMWMWRSLKYRHQLLTTWNITMKSWPERRNWSSRKLRWSIRRHRQLSQNMKAPTLSINTIGEQGLAMDSRIREEEMNISVTSLTMTRSCTKAIQKRHSKRNWTKLRRERRDLLLRSLMTAQCTKKMKRQRKMIKELGLGLVDHQPDLTIKLRREG